MGDLIYKIKKLSTLSWEEAFLERMNINKKNSMRKTIDINSVISILVRT